jgi:hypothetical protein
VEQPAAPEIDLAAIASRLERGPDGVWVARRRSGISYPEKGNENCLGLEEDSFWFEHRSRCIQALMRRFPPSGAVFDVGGGNGYVAGGLRQAGIPAVVVEPGRQGIRNALRRGLEPLVCATLEEAGFLPETLPAVGLFDVLEHVRQDEDFLRMIFPLLVPGGRIYLTAPAFRLLWSVDDDYAGHFRRYSASGLRCALARAGFQVEYSGYIFSMLPLPLLLLRALPSRLGWRKGDDWRRYQQEHTRRRGAAGWLLQRWLDWELGWLRQGHSIPLGGSCLAVARKPAAAENRKNCKLGVK